MRTKDFTASERVAIKNIIAEKTGYYIRNNNLLKQAFTRSSYSAEQGGENNEILEFIGDQVLGYYVVQIVAEHYGALSLDGEYTFRGHEHFFTQIKQGMVCNEALAQNIDKWGIVEYIIVGKSDYLNENTKQVKMKADLFEAILGAIAVSSGWNQEVLKNAVSNMLEIDKKLDKLAVKDSGLVQFDLENAVTVLKELTEQRKCTIVEYKFSEPEEPEYDKDGNPQWWCRCSVINDKTGITRQVWASSKKVSKKAAAYLVLCEHFQVQNQYGVNRQCGVWKYENGKLLPYV